MMIIIERKVKSGHEYLLISMSSGELHQHSVILTSLKASGVMGLNMFTLHVCV